MALIVSIGETQELDGRQAGLQAAHQALNKMGAAVPNMGILIASYQYQARDVASGVASLLGDIPLIGLSTPASLSATGLHTNSVIIILFSGDFQADAHWLPGYAQSGRETGTKLMQLSMGREEPHGMLFFADGFNGDAEQLCATMVDRTYPLMGALSGGDLHTGNNYQIAGNQTGSGALAAVFMRGNIRVGVGFAHGWDPVGSQFRVTRSRGFWLRTLDGRPASETYAQLFGYAARDWAFPPLNYLARIYPLGVEQGDDLVIRAPIRVEADGSFRMNAAIRDGVDAYLLVGSRAACDRAAQQATQQALMQLGNAKPAFVLVLVDMAWQMLLKANPGAEIAVVQEIIGNKVPIAGGYTLGQVVPNGNLAPRFLNQHIMVIAFGESESK
jgi:hypothetical protein